MDSRYSFRLISRLALPGWLLWGIGLSPIALIFAARQWVVDLTIVSSQSMAPTLVAGDLLLLNKLAYRFGEPTRGDVAAFHLPGERGLLVKRIVGLPGDRIETHRGKLHRNGERKDEPYLLNDLMNYELAPFTVPDGGLLMLGDNRNASADSVVWGFLPREALVGRAVKIVWPADRAGGL